MSDSLESLLTIADTLTDATSLSMAQAAEMAQDLREIARALRAPLRTLNAIVADSQEDELARLHPSVVRVNFQSGRVM